MTLATTQGGGGVKTYTYTHMSQSSYNTFTLEVNGNIAKISCGRLYPGTYTCPDTVDGAFGITVKGYNSSYAGSISKAVGSNDIVITASASTISEGLYVFPIWYS